MGSVIHDRYHASDPHDHLRCTGDPCFRALRSLIRDVFDVADVRIYDGRDLPPARWFSACGSRGNGTASPSLDERALASERDVYVVEDTESEWQASDLNGGAGRKPTAFYAATKLRNAEGDLIGLLSMRDPDARSFSDRDRRRFLGFRAMAERELELRTQIEGRRIAGKFARSSIQLLEMVASGKPTASLLEALLTNIEAVTPGVRTSFFRYEPKTGSLCHEASPGLPASYHKQIEGLSAGPRGGSCGTAAYRCEPVIVTDIGESPLWRDYRDLADAHNLGACLSHPVCSKEGTVLGTLTFYWDQAHQPTDEELQFAHLASYVAGLVLERERMEQQLYRSRERLRLAVDAAELGVWDWEADKDVHFNDQFARILGYEPDEVSFDRDYWLSLVHPSDRERVQSFVDAYESGEHTGEFSMECRVRTKNGSYAWVHDFGGELGRHPDGRLKRAVGVRRDVTLEKQSASLNQRLGAIMNGSLEEIYLFDAETLAFTLVNRGAQLNLGYSLEELKHMRVPDIGMQGFSEKSVREVVEALITHKKESISFQATHRRKDGSTYPVRIRAQLAQDREPHLILAFASDLTEQRAHERALVKAQHKAEVARYAAERAREREAELHQLKSNFLTNMSHEIRTPLTAIIGFSELLQEEVNEESKEWIDTIKQSGDRLLETLTSVLDLAKLESDSYTITPTTINISKSVEDAVDMFMPTATQKGLALQIDMPEKAVWATLDHGAVSRVLTNRLSNAIKFTDDGGVNVRLTSDADGVYIDVIDTGVGIDPCFLPKLFDDFRQESHGLSRAYEGSGLGLAISHRLVSLMNGSIDVTSTKGSGSTFTVTLPLDASATMENDNQSSPKPRLLLVEDSEEAQHLISIILEHEFEVDITDNVDSAASMASETPYDVFLVDIHLRGEKGGVEFVQEVNKNGHEDVPKIAWTAFALPGDEEHLLNAGFAAYVAKPTRRADLLSTLHEVLEAET